MLEFLKKKAIEADLPCLCAKCKDGSWVIYIRPDVEDATELLLKASLQIAKDKL